MLRAAIITAALLIVGPARADGPPAKKAKGPDFLGATLIAVDVPVDLNAAAVTYRLIGRKPINDIPADGRQEAVRKDDRTVEVVVRPAEQPADGGGKLPVKAPEGMESCLTPTLWLESGSPEIRELTAKALDGETGALAAARKLEAFVHGWITDKNLKTAFGTAKQTAKTRAGDCTEHAVLLAAMGRAAGIPTRVAAGLVYADQFVGRKQLFAYHMWTEMYIAGAWRPFDAALHGRGGYGVGHIALATSDMSAFNSDARLGVGLINMVGNLRIEVVEQKPAGGGGR